MSSAQALTQPKTKTNPALKAVQVPQATLPDPVHVIGELVEAYLNSKGAPQMVSSEVSDTIEKAAKKVPSWVLYLLLFFGGPLMLGIYAQYQTYKDLPDRMEAVETAVQTIQTDVKTILSNQKPKE